MHVKHSQSSELKQSKLQCYTLSITISLKAEVELTTHLFNTAFINRSDVNALRTQMTFRILALLYR